MENNQLIKQYKNSKIYLVCTQRKEGGRTAQTTQKTTNTTTEGGELIWSQRGGGMKCN